MSHVFAGERTWLSPVVAPLERMLLAALNVRDDEEQTWRRYALDLLVFSAACTAVAYVTFRLQHRLPLNPRGFGPMRPDLALNTAVSFVSNTSWQSYAGETTLSYFSQIAGIAFQSFLSAGVGLAAGIAVIRGFARTEADRLGNFWVDLVRSILYVLLPLSLVFAVLFLAQGVPQSWGDYAQVTTAEGAAQWLARGPVAAQLPITLMGAVGGGFFNVNSAHPYANPTPLCDFLQLVLLLLLPSALVHTFGRNVGNRRHAWAIWLAMAALLVAGVGVTASAERAGNPLLARAGAASATNLEGKEARFGAFESALYATATTATSDGAVNSMHDSFTPLGGLVPMVNMKLGEVIFGGLGAGLYGILMYVILTVFMSGLMIGRTPEYLGKPLGARQVKLALLSMVILALPILVLSSVGLMLEGPRSALGNPGHHGFSEILYAYASATGNNGSAFAGLSTDAPFWNLTLALAMFIGRYIALVPVLALAASVATQRRRPPSVAAFPVEGPLFVGLLISVIVVVGALTFFPAFALGPIAEHFEMTASAP
jgi:K+-transporting ATPase ATPase A chain